MPRRSLWVMFGGILFALACYERAERSPIGRWVSEAIEAIDESYYEEVDDEKLFHGALKGIVGNLDEYSAFFSRTDTKEFNESISQHYGGIGVEVFADGPDKVLTVASPLPSGPGYKAGMRSGDQIISVDGKSTENLRVRDLVPLLRGPVGTPVVVRVRRPGQEEPLEFHLARGDIRTDSVLGDARGADGRWNYLLARPERIGYVRVTSFSDATVREFDAAMKTLAAQKCRGLVIDLRNNPGGLLQSAEQICNLFLPEGAVIVSTRGRDQRERSRLVADGKGPYVDLPLVVLVNSFSASASEIVAACLQDNHRAAIVGERTWGKGTVQNIVPLEGGKISLKLTVGTYWRPSGVNIHRTNTSEPDDLWGVSPDHGNDVRLADEQLEQWVEKRRQRDTIPQSGMVAAAADAAAPAPSVMEEFDPQLKRAIEILRDELEEPPTKA